MNKRIFIEKRIPYQQEANALKQQLNDLFGLSLNELKSYVIYDVFNCEETTFEQAKKNVFSETMIEQIHEEVSLEHKSYICYEPVDGQFDQRADSAIQCVRLIDPFSEVVIKSGRLLVFDCVDSDALIKIKDYLVNPVESQNKDLDVLSLNENVQVTPMEKYEGFITWEDDRLKLFYQQNQLAMSYEDLRYIQKHFKQLARDPKETELKVLDTYWSDHCRHTTFMSELETIEFDHSRLVRKIEDVFNEYLEDRRSVGRDHKPITLMDLATTNAKLEQIFKEDSPIEVSEEVNACSVVIDVDHDGVNEKWLLMFKNETHNHPTEIEPFGGASTCIGGAIRDPLSGRAYVYQAMRISGAGNVLAPLHETLAHKLPQSLLAKKATQGNASYGNQIGLATTFVHEIYHPSYVAKHLECGAVVGAVKQSDVVRETPQSGDVILLLGGRTGRDGIGGATGSSVIHKKSSLKQSAAEVQKGNAPEEHKIQRLFRKPEVTRKIKRCNDFGAGGVSVAIGELADGLDIQLDKVRVKYKGLNATELAISESQERMAIVVRREDVEFLIHAAFEENCEAYEVAQVSDSHHLRMTYHGELMVDLDRNFLNSGGVRQKATVHVQENHTESVLNHRYGTDYHSLLEQVSDLKFASQKGLSERFDHTIGASTVLGGYCGKTQQTPALASVQKLPVMDGKTDTCSILTYGFVPEIFEFSPYLGGERSIVESVSKTIAVGGELDRIYLSLQEYFGRLVSPEKWGNVLQALLGAYHAMKALGLAAIGGKDSMSGTFETLDVVDTLISFACSTQKRQEIISQDLKKKGNKIYVLAIRQDELGQIDFEDLKYKYQQYYNHRYSIKSAMTSDRQTLLLTLFKMSLGNELGFDVQGSSDLLGRVMSGSIVFESEVEIKDDAFIYLGEVSDIIQVNGEVFSKETLVKEHHQPLEAIYPIQTSRKEETIEVQKTQSSHNFVSEEKVDKVKVVVPVFPGTNCEYDSARVFENLGAEVELVVFNNLTPQSTQDSLNRLVKAIDAAHILFFAGGFSSGDEPDGSAKYIVNVLKCPAIKAAITKHLEQNRLILGICNGFQALIKSGLIPYGEIRDVSEQGLTLFHNEIGAHVSTWVHTTLVSNHSPWLTSMKVNDVYKVPVSHGEGRLVGDISILDPKQIAFQYSDDQGHPTMVYPNNPNGSVLAIESLLAREGLILGKMAHSERVNEWQSEIQDIFKNGVEYFRKGAHHGN